MAESRRTITYEVQALRGSRWEIHARFDSNSRRVALAQARTMDRHPRLRGVRVVKEIYDPDLGRAEEYVIYKSGIAGRPVRARAPIKPRRRQQPHRLGQMFSAPLPFGVLAVGMIKAVVLSPYWTVLPRALLGTTAAFLAAVLATGITAYLFNGQWSIASAAPSGAEVATLLTVFSGIFLLAAVLVAFLLTAGPSRQRPPPSTRRRPQPPRRTGARPLPPPLRPPLTPMSSLTSAGDEVATRLPRRAEEVRGQVVDYLRQAIQPARGAYDLTDSYIRFGINLFVTGACETLCQERGIEAPIASGIVAAGLRAVGVDANHAASLAENYVEYLISDGRYMTMFGRGREAIMARLAAKADATDRLLQALDEWTQEHRPQNTQPIVTVMFTRMVGFEEFVAARGDEAARQVVRAHNQIVDRRLAEFHGKRIKHVDDGIMAAFTSAADAIRAAQAIRTDCAEQSRRAGDRRLALAVGLNCGEPIAEGNDLFGVSVQLAARIVSVAKPGQILASEAVRNRLLTEAPTATFTACEPVPLKGFGAPLPLYEPSGI